MNEIITVGDVVDSKKPGRFSQLRHKVALGMSSLGLAVMGLMVSSHVAMATTADDIDSLFNEVQIATVQASSKTLYVAFIGLAVLGLGYAVVTKAIHAGKRA